MGRGYHSGIGRIKLYWLSVSGYVHPERVYAVYDNLGMWFVATALSAISIVM